MNILLMKLVTLTIVGLQYTYHRFLRLILGPKSYDEENVEGKVVIVTGANIGIGKATAFELAQRGATVIMACRNMVEGKKALEDIQSRTSAGKLELMYLDLNDLSLVEKFAKNVTTKYSKINILINNAGFYNQDPLSKTKDGFETHIGVNHLGHFLLTNLLLDHLKKGAPGRVVNVSSTAMLLSKLNLDDLMMTKATTLGIGNMLPYCNSKFANGLFAYELGKKLKGTGVTAYSLCPGMVKSAFLRSLPWYRRMMSQIPAIFVGLSVEQGCETVVYCAVAKEIANETGKFYRFCEPLEMGNNKLKDDLAARLWEESEKLVKLKEHQH